VGPDAVTPGEADGETRTPDPITRADQVSSEDCGRGSATAIGYRLCMVDERLDTERALPGRELVEQGLADLQAGEVTIESLLVSIGAPRLRRRGFDGASHARGRRGAPLPPAGAGRSRRRPRPAPRARPPAGQFRTGSRIRELADAERIKRLLAALDEAAEQTGRCYLTDGGSRPGRRPRPHSLRPRRPGAAKPLLRRDRAAALPLSRHRPDRLSRARRAGTDDRAGSRQGSEF
jgi:hypothetical protein